MDKKKLLLATIIIFVAFMVLYFLKIPAPYKQLYPMTLLFVTGCMLQSWPIIVAVFFSGLGDYFGMMHHFIPQMAAFAVAHLCYIGYFLALGLKNKRAKGKPVPGWWFAVATIFSVAVFYIASERIIPFAPEGVVRTGMYIYAGLITVMMWSALMQRDWLFGLGAVLFVFSDSVLAVNKFVQPIPFERYWIMVPYLTAQLLIFVRAAQLRQKTA